MLLESDMGLETEDGMPAYLQPDKESGLDAGLNLPSAPTGHAAVPAGQAGTQASFIFQIENKSRITQNENIETIGFLNLKRNVRRDGMVEALDNDGNTILHLATKKGNSPRVHLGHLNQMAWDAYWLKRIWYDSPTHFLYLQNTAGKTPNEIFEENHSDLRVKAEKALKDMNNGLMLFSALIGTVNYAAIFTIPGGIDQDRKSTNFSHPTLYHSNHETDLLLFLWYTGGGLFSSFVALVTMVAIQLSRFCSNDFYMALPIRYVVALTAIFVSTVFTTNACFKAYDIMDIKFNVDVLWDRHFSC
ncbi:hypothetical protein Acr_03g0014270 [Actinidia rufa]|uniref:PGG domain-containing protein n=1 Tax=Actinidia rufa TaxID=165716 RepID=A0A7J0EDW0_9ERIC|nr:hypothetical protein Acr_03g0014270 [Actinidia rufa]